jgi:hypothetical protein
LYFGDGMRHAVDDAIEIDQRSRVVDRSGRVSAPAAHAGFRP